MHNGSPMSDYHSTPAPELYKALPMDNTHSASNIALLS